MYKIFFGGLFISRTGYSNHNDLKQYEIKSVCLLLIKKNPFFSKKVHFQEHSILGYRYSVHDWGEFLIFFYLLIIMNEVQ